MFARIAEMPMTSEAPLQVLLNILVVLGLCTVTFAVGIFFLMQIRHARNLAREARRLSFANLIVPPLDGRSLEELWTSSSRDDRKIIEEVLATQRNFLERQAAADFERIVTGSAIYPALIRRLRSGKTLERVHAVKVLGYFHDPRGIEAIAKSICDPCPEVVVACVLSLGRLKSPLAIPTLIEFVHKGQSLVPDVTLVGSLAACASKEPKKLVPLLHSVDSRPRILGAWALSEVADNTVLSALMGTRRDPDPEVRAKVARALARISEPDSVEALIFLANDESWFVRVRALDALGKLQAPAGEPIALAALFDNVREVRYRAASALRQIKGMHSEVLVKAITEVSLLGFNSLVSEWERAGFLEAVVDDLSGQDVTRRADGEKSLKALIGAGLTSALENLVLVHPNIEARLDLSRLLLETADDLGRNRLLALAKDSRCDRRVAEAILREGARIAGGLPSEAGSA
jgi:HEAT repeat protein